jgi:predicted small secreted protein
MPIAPRAAHPGLRQQQMPGRTAGAFELLQFHDIRCYLAVHVPMNRLVPTAVVPVLAMVLAACGGGNTAPGAGTPFCGNAAFVDALIASRSGSEIAFLKTHEIRIDELRNHAPAAVKADVITIVTAVHSAIVADNPAVANTATMNRAWSAVKTYCGIGQ